ncbi:Low-density lipoprotein receptor repeat class B, partial [Cooperia oncophora]
LYEITFPGTNPNPCALNNGGCSHFCLLLNFHPWSQCSCPVGIKLLDDEKTCDPRGIDKILFISAVSGIYHISLDTPDFTPKQILFEGLNNDGFSHKFYDIDFDPIERKIYWIDASVGQIRRCSGNGSSAEDVLSIPNSVRVFRIDYLARNIYWIDANLNRLYVTKLGTTHTRVIVARGVLKLHTMALDLKNRHIYFSNGRGEQSHIDRCDLDGSNRTRVVTLAPYAWPNGIAVDADNYHLYWTEGNYSVVRTAFLNGTEQVVIGPASLKLPQPYAISTLGQELFCNSLAGRALMRISTTEGTGALTANVIESSIYGPIGLVAVSLHSTISNVSSCALSKCMHLCIVSAEGVPKCLCSMGYELMSDERTCRKPSSYFVILQEDITDISRASLEKPINFDSLDILNITEPPTTADIDQRGNYIVFGYSSSRTGFIKRASFTGAVPETVINDPTLIGMHSLSVDWISRNIYWSNPSRGRIEVCDHSGKYRRTLASRSIKPTSLTVHPLAGAVFFVNELANVTIRRMPLNGDSTGGQDIVGDLTSVRSLAIDFRKDLLYWTEFDDFTTRISVSKLNGELL